MMLLLEECGENVGNDEGDILLVCCSNGGLTCTTAIQQLIICLV
jgi:hypothetical protein